MRAFRGVNIEPPCARLEATYSLAAHFCGKRNAARRRLDGNSVYSWVDGYNALRGTRPELGEHRFDGEHRVRPPRLDLPAEQRRRHPAWCGRCRKGQTARRDKD